MNTILITKSQKKVERCFDRFFLFLYKRNLKHLVYDVRKKKIIKVLFVVFELGSWKTIPLYWAMKHNSRFHPLVVVTPSIENPLATGTLLNYLINNKIEYTIANGEVRDLNQLQGDILFYQKPYDGCYPTQYLYKNNLNSLFCYVFYGHHSLNDSPTANMPLYEVVWLRFFENQAAIEELKPLIRNKKNLINTGFPSIDSFLSEAKCNPWIRQEHNKKKIIYAPHHTIANLHEDRIAYSTFLEYGDFILQMAIKYKDVTQWAFKPHPRLYDKLLVVWGKQKTDEYYEKWSMLKNAQIENGAYADLFKTSDAMIHDCGSFTIEYLTTQNPVLYLTHGASDHHADNMLPYAKLAFDLHYKAYNCAQIEEFVQNVIQGVDPMREERENYFHKYLLPPHGKTACENIMNAILGEAEYSNIKI